MNLSYVQEAFFETGNSLNFVQQNFWAEVSPLETGPLEQVMVFGQAQAQAVLENLAPSLSQFIQTIEQLATEIYEDLEDEVVEFADQVFGEALTFVKDLIEYDFYLS